MYHLIHANIAKMLASLDDPIMADFVKKVDMIDALARSSQGFIDQPAPREEGKIFSGNLLLNLSIWESVEDLESFTYQGKHSHMLDRRSEWFEQYGGPKYVLYWEVAGHIPSESEVKQRLEYLTKHGPTPFAFTFEKRFSVEEVLVYRLAQDS